MTTPPSCEGLPGTDEELALTPRTDAEAEVLALRIAGTFTADTPTYERIRRDLASIRSRAPALQNVRGRSYSSYVSLQIDHRPTFESMKAGTYTAWDCLHARYGWTDAQLHESTHFDWTSASGTLIGRYDMHVIDGLYEALPGVTNASSAAFLDGPTVCADRDADGTYHYVFDDADGDCESGCMDHHFYYFVSAPDGQITAKGEDANGPLPDWAKRIVYEDGHCY